MMDYLTLRPQHVDSPLDAALSAFLLDREAALCSPSTLDHYRYTAGGFVAYLQTQGVQDVADITPHHIRSFLIGLKRRGLKDTTQHANARGIKAWLNWLVREGDLDVSPMARVTMPRVEQRVPPPFEREDVQKLLDACDRHKPKGSRDYALILTLLDSGLRASELIGLCIGDIDMRTGMIVVIGKGAKQRETRVGAKARGAILRMLGYRSDPANGEPLWMGYTARQIETKALSVKGLQTLLHRLGRQVGVMPCAPHRFRRTFALWCLRDGMDLHSLRMLMGHSTLAVLQRYLALAGQDLERAHAAHSPADRLLERR